LRAAGEGAPNCIAGRRAAIIAPSQIFYDSLSDEQKQRFNMIGSAGSEGWAPSGGPQALCSSESAGATNVPVERIEQVVRPNAQQQESFDALKKAAADAAQALQASCPSAIPLTPVARLDAAAARLKAIVAAINTVRPQLATFYASLSDEQKARFNAMGPPPRSAAAQDRRQSDGQ